MFTTPHVPPPVGNQVVAALFALIVGAVGAFVFSRAAPGLRARIRRAPVVAGAVITICTFAIVMQTRATDRMFGGYFSFKTPRERFRDHIADFEERVVRNPEIRGAIGQYPDASEMLQSLARRGLPRLDDATLRQQSRLMGMLLSQLSDHVCSLVYRYGSLTESNGAELEDAMLKLGAGFVSEWMQVLYKQMLAEVRKAPIPAISGEDLGAAYRALEVKIGADPARRVADGLKVGASDLECCRAVKTIYQVAPTLPEPHATVTLRMMAQR